MSREPLVSVIIPVHNGEKWINNCFESILKQEILKSHKIEISVYDDASVDDTRKLLKEWNLKISQVSNLSMVFSHANGEPKGVGYAKNRAIEQSRGKYLCFQDVDDLMLPRRISEQLKEAIKYPDAIVGCQVKRIPEKSTPRLTSWANNLPQSLLRVQIYTSHGPTVLMPTWFFDRNVFKKVGLFSEEGRGTPEDLLFFYSHLDGGGTVRRVDEILLIYRYHPGCTTFSIPEWTQLTIWNAGKQGRRFYRSLQPCHRLKVKEFCDVDPKKTGTFYQPYSKSGCTEKVKIPIVHFTEAKPPFVTCVKLDLTGGEFERNVQSLNMIEGRDYFVFS